MNLDKNIDIAKQMRDLRKYRKENGLCIKCGCTNNRIPRVYCTTCNESIKEYERIQRENRKKNHQCIDCGKNINSQGVRCSECLNKHNKRVNKSKNKKVNCVTA